MCCLLDLRTKSYIQNCILFSKKKLRFATTSLQVIYENDLDLYLSCKGIKRKIADVDNECNTEYIRLVN